MKVAIASEQRKLHPKRKGSDIFASHFFLNFLTIMIDLKLMCIEIFKFEGKCVDKNIANKNIYVESSESRNNARNNIALMIAFRVQAKIIN